MRPTSLNAMRPSLQALMRPTPLLALRPTALKAYKYDGPGPNHPKPFAPFVFLLKPLGMKVYPSQMWPLYNKLLFAVLLVGYGWYALQNYLIELPKFRNSPDNPNREWQDARDAKLAGVAAH
ncbi:hypothetical protein BDY24DRAFT_387468 [Mrakia frigida]|uniref:uncharacterized protein n=1 Tax=Mrakia frigida TaxID=29902 RepID=UPI003FCBEEFF